MKYSKLINKIIITTLVFLFTTFFKAVYFVQQVSACSCPGSSSCSVCGLQTVTYSGCFSGTTSTLICSYDPTCEGSNTVPCDSSSCPGQCSCNPSTDIYCTCDPNASNAGCGLPNAWGGVCFSDGTNSGCIGNQRCETIADGNSCFANEVEVYCCDTPQPTDPPAGPGPGDPAPTSPPPGPTATPVPTAGPRAIIGNLYEDATATTTGLGGTDNLCTGSTGAPVFIELDMPETIVRATRTGGESSSGAISLSRYTITTLTSNNDYTITLQLPFPPPDPANAWQCACNADPGDPYRCTYTNQMPSNITNFDFFLKRANVADAAWFQTLGGSSWASNNIESLIPTTTCTAPTCQPALIADDPSGTADSAGFPLTNTGSVITSATGDNYIHETDARTNAAQARATGVSVPIENYDYFYDKLGDQAQALASAGKPIVGTDLEIYKYTGNLTITETAPWNLTNTEKIIVFVDGDLLIDDITASQARITSVATGGDGFLMFIVSGNITVSATVGYNNIATNPTTANIANVEGIFVADGVFTIAGNPGTIDKKFIGAGTFVGWTGVELQRNFDDGTNPTNNDTAATETFIFRPDLLLNAPKAIKSAQMTWREVQPSF